MQRVMYSFSNLTVVTVTWPMPVTVNLTVVYRLMVLVKNMGRTFVSTWVRSGLITCVMNTGYLMVVYRVSTIFFTCGFGLRTSTLLTTLALRSL